MIKTIVAPVDFSNEAANALLFAAEIAKRVSGELIILHALAGDDDPSVASGQLTKLEAELTAAFGTDLRVTSQMASGGLIPALNAMVGKNQADLVVMGTQGATGLKRVFIGSNTVKVLADTQVSVFVIPGSARFEDFNRKGKNRVVFATDLEEVAKDEALDLLAEITSLMVEPKLRILNVRPKNTRLGFTQEMERSALVSRFRENIETERITVFDSSVVDGINFYLDKHQDTGMLAMVSRDSEGLFEPHFTHQMASMTHYPFLVLQDRKR